METTFWTPNVGTPAASVTINIPDTIIPQGQAVQYLLYSRGVAAFGNVTRLRLLANGQTIWDVSNKAYVAMLQRFSANHLVLPAGSKIIPILVYLTDQKGQNARYSSQVPPGARMSIQLDFGSFSPSGEALDLLTTFTTVKPLSYPTLISSPSNVSASQVNQVVQIKQNVLMRGFYLEALANITRIELNASGVMLYNGASGPAFANEQIFHQSPDVATQILTEVFNKVGPISVGGDGTQLLLSVDGSYAATKEYAIYGAVPVGQPEGSAAA